MSTVPADEAAYDELMSSGARLSLAGDVTAARASFAEAAEIARRMSSPDRLSRAALGYGAGAVVIGFGYEPNEMLIALAEEALRSPPADAGLRARLQARLAIELYWTDRAAKRRALAEAAVAGALASGNVEDLLIAKYAMYIINLPKGDPATRLEASGELLALAEQNQDMSWLFETLFLRLHVLAELGRTFEYDEVLTRVERIAEVLKTPMLRSRAIHARGARTIFEGRLERAEERFLEAMAQGHDVPEIVSANGAVLLLVRWLQGRLAEVEPVIMALGERFPQASAARGAAIMFLAELGRTQEARLALQHLEHLGFDKLRRDHHFALFLFCLAISYARIGDDRKVEQLREMLRPFAPHHIASPGGTVSFGSALLPLGLLAATAGDWDDAVAELEAAVDANAAAGNRPFTVFAMLELASALAGAGQDQTSKEIAAETVELAQQLGMHAFARRAARLLEPGPARPAAELKREGDGWRVGFGERSGRLPDLKGLAHLATLLRAPYEEVHVLQLLMPGGDAGVAALRTVLAHDAGPVLDDSAREAYRRRLKALAEKRDAARASGDGAREEEVDVEIEAIERQLSAATGLGGRPRSLHGPAERGRVSITKALRTAIERIGDIAPELAVHLAASVRTGAYCSYFPRESDRPDWRL